MFEEPRRKDKIDFPVRLPMDSKSSARVSEFQDETERLCETVVK